MWRSSFLLLKEGLSSSSSAIVRSKPKPKTYMFGSKHAVSVQSSYSLCNCLFSTSSVVGGGGDGGAMRRLSFLSLKHGLHSTIGKSEPKPYSFGSKRVVFVESSYCNCLFSTSAGVGGDGDGGRREVNDVDNISFAEAKKLMRLVNVEALKTKFCTEGKEVISYSELLQACESIGVAKTVEEAKAFATVLDEAGVVLIFRDKVYLHPDKVVDLVRKAVPLALTPDDDPRRQELKELQAKQDEIDRLAHKQVRRILYTGLGFSLAQIGLFFRLTFWEFSWDVMEPIAFFTTTSGIIVGYAYFLITSRDPTYQDFMKRLFLSRRKKLMKKHNFDVERFMELQKKCKSPLDAHPSAKHVFAGVELETQDLLHKN
ncbi:hypothetical protein QVD17_17416 [Tagetes erecta]|uniref:Calcium uniporter protein C-terminal domain-containing protein n=1 Tax=Tagetes erecta TaxID=13708 RepID=A0AAD8KT64_TARER|nr:hypothetical protein QVD17_17416 [Tagetes erecta]